MDVGGDDLEIVEPPTVPNPIVDEPTVPEPAVDEPTVDEATVDEPREVVVPATPTISLDALRAAVAAAPADWGAHRTLAEALLEHGERDEAMVELEAAMAGYEADGDLDSAGSVADEIVRLEPTSIRSHKKRVEYAFRSNHRQKLATAYLELADALLADGQAQQARTVYQRVLDITPDDLRAQAAIESIPAEEAPPPPPPRRNTVAPAKPAAPTPAPAAAGDDDDYVSLGDWLREDDEPKSTRMVVEEQEPTGDEQADFSDMLRKFKQGVAENVDDEDHEAHYDLGVAYKEMGLVDEAIAEFQKALRGTKERARTFEALGNCFIEKGQLPVAATILQRALAEPGVRDEALVGVLYLLGAIAEEQQQFPDAKRYYERVFAVDIQFRDIGDRLNTVEQQLS
jgi:tetratricopeptide (TPR) repeat protein